ncbi:MAG TPA: hypothetical protein VGJ60_15090, partial [Chloroflexota bacterium]
NGNLTVNGNLKQDGNQVGFFGASSAQRGPLPAASASAGTTSVCTNITTCGPVQVASSGTTDEVSNLRTRVQGLEDTLRDYGLLK